MGLVSYLEDISERLAEDVVRLEWLATSRVNSVQQTRQEAAALLKSSRDVLAQIDDLREMAQNPRFDLAFEVVQLEADKKTLESQIGELTEKRDRLLDHATSLEHRGKADRQEVKDLRRRLAAKERELEAILRANPEGAYAMYSDETFVDHD